MVYRQFLLATILLLALAAAASAGSIFSANGNGEPLVGGGMRAAGLAGGGYGLADSMGFNTDNPALAAYAQRTLVRLGGRVSFWQTKSAGKSEGDSEFEWQNIFMYFPVARNWRFGLGAEPTYGMDLQTLGTGTAVFHDPGGADTSSVKFQERQTWRGSGTDLRLDNAVKLSDKLAVGLTLSYAVNRIERFRRMDLPPYDEERSSSLPYVDAEYTARELYRGWSAVVGAHYQFSPRFSAGLSYRPRVAGRWYYRFRNNVTGFTSEANRKGDRPGEVRIGGSYLLNKRLNMVADLAAGQWSKGDLGYLADSAGVIKPESPLFVSIGFERMAGKVLTTAGFDTWGLRGGLYYRKHYWPLRNSTAVTDMAVTAGLSIPVASHSGWIHIALEGGLRGADEKKLGAKETFMRAGVQLEISEKWFDRPKPRLPK